MKFPHTIHSFVPSSCGETTGGLGTVTGGAKSSKELWMSTTTTHEIPYNSSRILKEQLRSMQLILGTRSLGLGLPTEYLPTNLSLYKHPLLKPDYEKKISVVYGDAGRYFLSSQNRDKKLGT